MSQDKWLEWAVRLQALAQTGLAYGKDVYDLERFEEIREIAAEMLIEPSGQPLEVVKDLFCNESGYQTPKLDTRAAIFQDNKILLVQENDGLWSLPAAGATLTNLFGKMSLRKSRKKRGWMWRLCESLRFWTSTRTILPSQPTA